MSLDSFIGDAKKAIHNDVGLRLIEDTLIGVAAGGILKGGLVGYGVGALGGLAVGIVKDAIIEPLVDGTTENSTGGKLFEDALAGGVAGAALGRTPISFVSGAAVGLTWGLISPAVDSFLDNPTPIKI